MSFTQLHSFATATNLLENHKKSADLIFIEFVEEFDNDENSVEFHKDFSFTSPTIDAFDFIIFNQSQNFTPKNLSFKITSNQKIHVLNCTFLI